MANINSIGIIIYSNGTIKETTNDNYIHSQKKLESEALSLNAPEILIDTKYKLSFMILNIIDETFNRMANHTVSMLKSEDIFNNFCILGNCYIFNENKTNIDLRKEEFHCIRNDIYK